MTVLPNGNIVVTDPYYDLGSIADVGAVYLYDGATGAQISMLTGSTAGDQVGGSPYPDTQPAVTVLSNGNYLMISPSWDNGAAENAGAVTWGSATTGVSGVVSAANSLVGSTAYDWIGFLVKTLSNGNYVVSSPDCDHGAVVDAGAVTWGGSDGQHRRPDHGREQRARHSSRRRRVYGLGLRSCQPPARRRPASGQYRHPVQIAAGVPCFPAGYSEKRAMIEQETRHTGFDEL